ncbi:MAG: AsnC family transcriptional regulator [Arenicellales bacterium]|nr:AsnC family transcriptional regulator [Arenicellales bacterium]
MDNLDRDIINRLQGGFPICDRPYQHIAEQLETTEDELIARLRAMIDDGRLSRFGPLYNVEKMGGSFVLCAMCVPSDVFDEVAERVNALPQVAHNYQRSHRLNMWFVLATESAEEISAVVDTIQGETGLVVYQFPKLDEYYIGLQLAV